MCLLGYFSFFGGWVGAIFFIGVVFAALQPHPIHARYGFYVFRSRLDLMCSFVFTSRRFQGHLLYGIRSVSAFADRMRTVVSDCEKAAKSGDARDKYFLSYVGEYDNFPAKGLRSEIPALEAVRASLEATISELADVAPRLASCRPRALPSILASARSPADKNFERLARQMKNEWKRFTVEEFDALFAEARASILRFRSVLA